MNYAALIDHLLPHALGHRVALTNTVNLTLTCLANRIPGDYVECGVFNGVHPALMARVLQDHGSKAQVHLFDSFEGIPHAGPKDDHTITLCIGAERDGALASTGISVATLPNVQRCLKDLGFHLPGPFRFHVGWFQNTVPTCGIDRIALLRLDGDLYESTQVCLDHLYDKVSPGGYVVVDDYNLTGCKLAVDEFLNARGLEPRMIPIEGQEGPVYWEVA
jgi:hypothetical protein